jgi:DNA-binding response OmpR family regulator
MTPRILVVEPDSTLRESVCLHLSIEGFRCEPYPGLEAVHVRAADADFVLAVMSLKATRADSRKPANDVVGRDVPKLVVAGPGRYEEALSALEHWADDYVTCPFDMRELVARAGALIRRKRMLDRNGDVTGNGDVAGIVHDGFRLDPSRRRVEVDGRVLSLTENEFRLLQTIARRPGIVFPRHVLLALFGADSRSGVRKVDSLVMGVRRQLTAAPGRWHINTVRGVGYQFKNTSP